MPFDTEQTSEKTGETGDAYSAMQRKVVSIVGPTASGKTMGRGVLLAGCAGDHHFDVTAFESLEILFGDTDDDVGGDLLSDKPHPAKPGWALPSPKRWRAKANRRKSSTPTHTRCIGAWISARLKRARRSRRRSGIISSI